MINREFFPWLFGRDKSHKAIYNRNKYKNAKQGEREKARRRRQDEWGLLNFSASNRCIDKIYAKYDD